MIKPINIGVIGGRDFNDQKLLEDTLSKLINERGWSLINIVSGGASGADLLGKTFAEDYNLGYIPFPAKWDDFSEPCVIKVNHAGKQYNALAGFNRNTDIVKNSNIVVAFWDGKSKGTRDSIDKCKTLCVELITVKY